MNRVIFVSIAGLLLASALSPALAQSDMPVIPPPSKRQAPAPGQAPSAPAQPQRVVTMEDLARQGFEVKAMQTSGTQAGRFVVILQRSGDIRTCLMSIEPRQGATPQRRSACF